MNFVRRLICKMFPPEMYEVEMTTTDGAEMFTTHDGRGWKFIKKLFVSRDVCMGCKGHHRAEKLSATKM